MESIRDNVGLDEFCSLAEIEQELLYKIHTKSWQTGETVSFGYIVTTFKSKYTYDDISRALNRLRDKGYLKSKTYYDTTFQSMEYPEDMEDL